MKIYVASVIATHHETKQVEHHLFSFSPRKDTELTPEQNAMEVVRGLLPQDELFDCQLKVIPIDLAKHFSAIESEESKEA